MELLISADLKQIMLLFVIVQLVLLFPFLCIGRNFLFNGKITTAATAERTTFCPHLHFGWRGMCQRKSRDGRTGMHRGELQSGAALAILLSLGSLVILGALIFVSLWKPQAASGSPASLGQEFRVATAVTPSGFEVLFQPAITRRWQLHDPAESTAVVLRGHGAERMAKGGGTHTSDQRGKAG